MNAVMIAAQRTAKLNTADDAAVVAAFTKLQEEIELAANILWTRGHADAGDRLRKSFEPIANVLKIAPKPLTNTKRGPADRGFKLPKAD